MLTITASSTKLLFHPATKQKSSYYFCACGQIRAIYEAKLLGHGRYPATACHVKAKPPSSVPLFTRCTHAQSTPRARKSKA